MNPEASHIIIDYYKEVIKKLEGENAELKKQIDELKNGKGNIADIPSEKEEAGAA